MRSDKMPDNGQLQPNNNNNNKLANQLIRYNLAQDTPFHN